MFSFAHLPFSYSLGWWWEIECYKIYISINLYITLHSGKVISSPKKLFQKAFFLEKGKKETYYCSFCFSFSLRLSDLDCFSWGDFVSHSFRKKKTFCGTMKVNYCDLSARTKRWERILTEILFIYSVVEKKNCSLCTFTSRKSSKKEEIWTKLSYTVVVAFVSTRFRLFTAFTHFLTLSMSTVIVFWGFKFYSFQLFSSP